MAPQIIGVSIVCSAVSLVDDIIMCMHKIHVSDHTGGIVMFIETKMELRSN